MGRWEDIVALVRAIGLLADFDDGIVAAGFGLQVKYPSCKGLLCRLVCQRLQT